MWFSRLLFIFEFDRRLDDCVQLTRNTMSVNLKGQKAVATLQTCLRRPPSAQILARAIRCLNSWRCYGEGNRGSAMHRMVWMYLRWSEECTRYGFFNGARRAGGSQATEVFCINCHLDDVIAVKTSLPGTNWCKPSDPNPYLVS